MPRANSVEQARRRSYFAAVEVEAYRLAYSPRRPKLINPWRALSDAERLTYQTGKQKVIGSRAAAFDQVYLQAARIRDSDLWEMADPGTRERVLAARLHAWAGRSINEIGTSELLDEVATGAFLSEEAAAVEELPMLICALRLSRASNHSERSINVALKLAERLLHLSIGDATGLSREMWALSQRFLGELTHDDHRLVFRDVTWKVVNQHLSAVQLKIYQYAFPSCWGAATLRDRTLFDISRAFVSAFACMDRSRLEFMLSRLREMSPWDERLVTIPDADAVGLWQAIE